MIEEEASSQLLDGGGEVYPRMLACIARAASRIHLEVYGFASDGVGTRFVDALVAAAQRGVKVRVVIDGWGSALSGSALAVRLRRAGCDVEIYNRLRAMLMLRFGRNHRKILLVDDEVAFIGGLNIGDEYLDVLARPGWADVALEIHGPQCARLGQLLRELPRHRVETSLRIYLCGHAGGWRLRRRYLKAIAGARRCVHLAHGYFVPDRAVLRALVAAARRGVAVHLLVGGTATQPFARLATRSAYRRLLAAGVRIYEWRSSVLHAKVAAIDGRTLLIGSFNLDAFSLANLETLVEVVERRLVAQGDAWIRRRVSSAAIVTTAEAGSWQRRWLLERCGVWVGRTSEAVGWLLRGYSGRGS